MKLSERGEKSLIILDFIMVDQPVSAEPPKTQSERPLASHLTNHPCKSIKTAEKLRTYSLVTCFNGLLQMDTPVLVDQ